MLLFSYILQICIRFLECKGQTPPEVQNRAHFEHFYLLSFFGRGIAYFLCKVNGFLVNLSKENASWNSIDFGKLRNKEESVFVISFYRNKFICLELLGK